MTLTTTPITTTRRSASVLAKEYEQEEQHTKISEQLRAAMMVGTLFCYVTATSLVLLAAFVLTPFLPILGRAFGAVLGLFTPANSENGYQLFALQAPAGGIAVAATSHLSSFISAVSSSLPSSIRSPSSFLSSVSSYAAAYPSPADVLPIGKPMASVLYNDAAFQQQLSYIADNE